MKILEITNYTSGGCGVGMRVLKESKLLAKEGHEVRIFSTNYKKGSNEICPSQESTENVKISRFPAKRLKIAGDSYLKWDFTKKALDFKPDIIIAHSYRHPHTDQAIKIAKKIKAKVFLVTHAPFSREETRNTIQNLGVKFYDLLIGKRNLRKFDGVIAITKWEMSHLKKLGVPPKKIHYIPNGIDKEFFSKIKNTKSVRKIIYLGRISPIKQIETMVLAISKLKDVNCTIRGPAEKEYLSKLKEIINKNKIRNVELVNKSYSHKEQIKMLDKSDIFILPSKSEGMPQSLVEAMARGKIVVGSKNSGNSDLIDDGKNGYLYVNGDEKDLLRVISNIQNLNDARLISLSRQARKTAERFKWENIMGSLKNLIK